MCNCLIVFQAMKRNKAFVRTLTQSRMRNGTRVVSPEQFPFLVVISVYQSLDPFGIPYRSQFCGGIILSKYLNVEIGEFCLHILWPHLEKV